MATVEEWDSRYRAAAQSPAAHLWDRHPAPQLEEIAAGLPPRRALDLATGDGRNAIWLASQGWEVTAVDSSGEALSLAAARAEAEGIAVDWVQGDVRTWSPVRLVDLITITYLHIPVAELEAVIGRTASWLAPGGHLIVIGHDRANLETGAPGPTDPSILYTPSWLASAAQQSGFTVLSSTSVTRTAAEHAGEDSGTVAIDTVLHAVVGG